jgi:hypothetical protein
MNYWEALEFLIDYGVRSSDKDDLNFVIAMSEDHHKINFEGDQYYVPDSRYNYTEKDYRIIESLLHGRLQLS